MNIPIIKLEIESMKQVIHHAFSQQMMDISTEVKHALSAHCTPENIQRIVNKAAEEAVSEAVSAAVKRWWAVSAEGRMLIDAAVAAKLNEEAAFYMKHKL